MLEEIVHIANMVMQTVFYFYVNPWLHYGYAVSFDMYLSILDVDAGHLGVHSGLLGMKGRG